VTSTGTPDPKETGAGVTSEDLGGPLNSACAHVIAPPASGPPSPAAAVHDVATGESVEAPSGSKYGRRPDPPDVLREHRHLCRPKPTVDVALAAVSLERAVPTRGTVLQAAEPRHRRVGQRGRSPRTPSARPTQ